MARLYRKPWHADGLDQISGRKVRSNRSIPGRKPGLIWATEGSEGAAQPCGTLISFDLKICANLQRRNSDMPIFEEMLRRWINHWQTYTAITKSQVKAYRPILLARQEPLSYYLENIHQPAFRENLIRAIRSAPRKSNPKKHTNGRPQISATRHIVKGKV